MFKNFFDGLLSVFVILSFASLVVGNIVRFVYWLKSYKARKNSFFNYYLEFWGDEWGTGCTKEEIEKLNQIIRQFEEDSK